MKTTIKSFVFGLLLLGTGVLVSCESEMPTAVRDVLYVRRQKVDLPAYVFGNAASNTFILVLHGGPGGNGLNYRFGQYSAQLEERYAMVYLDQRGQGNAQGAYGLEELTIDEMVEDVRAVALTLKHKYGQDINLFLMGHSWGGTLGTAVLIKKDYQTLFNGWIEVDGAHDLPLVYSAGVRMFQSLGPEQIAKGNSVDFWTRVVDSTAKVNINPRLASEDEITYLNKVGYEAESELQAAGDIAESDLSEPGLLLESVFIYNNALTSWWSGDFTNQELTKKGLEQYTATPSLSRITIPTLLLWGKYDFVVSPELGESALEEISSTDKELVIFEASGHTPMDTEPEEFVNTVTTFIQRNN